MEPYRLGGASEVNNPAIVPCLKDNPRLVNMVYDALTHGDAHPLKSVGCFGL